MAQILFVWFLSCYIYNLCMESLHAFGKDRTSLHTRLGLCNCMELLQVSELIKHFQRPSYIDFLGSLSWIPNWTSCDTNDSWICQQFSMSATRFNKRGVSFWCGKWYFKVVYWHFMAAKQNYKVGHSCIAILELSIQLNWYNPKV